MLYTKDQGFPWWPGGQESPCQCGERGFYLWSGKISCATKRLKPVPQGTVLALQSREPQLLSPRAPTREAGGLRARALQ